MFPSNVSPAPTEATFHQCKPDIRRVCVCVCENREVYEVEAELSLDLPLHPSVAEACVSFRLCLRMCLCGERMLRIYGPLHSRVCVRALTLPSVPCSPGS